MRSSERLLDIRRALDEAEKKRFSRWACLSSEAVRRRPDEDTLLGHRQFFSVDTDRILHSLAYSRYIDKTQVFYLVKNDHITHRVLHVQLVSKIARTIGRLLRLNEDLIEAIALGHDIGHAPFGHDGEAFLSALCEAHGIGTFQHSLQSVRFLQSIERKGRGWNLALQVLDGIFCHNGELHTNALEPLTGKSFERLDEEMQLKRMDPKRDIWPMTLEGCVVRLADTISYIGRDIEDAIRLGLIRREDLPGDCVHILGNTNGTIVYTLVEDLAAHSLDQPFIRFSEAVGEALQRLKAFNHEAIYQNRLVKEQTPKIKIMFELMFDRYLRDLEEGNETSEIHRAYLEGMSSEYREKTPPAGIVRDFLAGMTDEYFLAQCRKNFFPEVRMGIL